MRDSKPNVDIEAVLHDSSRIFLLLHEKKQDIRLISSAAASKNSLIVGRTVPVGQRPRPHHMLLVVVAAAYVSSHLQY